MPLFHHRRVDSKQTQPSILHRFYFLNSVDLGKRPEPPAPAGRSLIQRRYLNPGCLCRSLEAADHLSFKIEDFRLKPTTALIERFVHFELGANSRLPVLIHPPWPVLTSNGTDGVSTTSPVGVQVSKALMSVGSSVTVAATSQDPSRCWPSRVLFVSDRAAVTTIRATAPAIRIAGRSVVLIFIEFCYLLGLCLDSRAWKLNYTVPSNRRNLDSRGRKVLTVTSHK